MRPDTWALTRTSLAGFLVAIVLLLGAGLGALRAHQATREAGNASMVALEVLNQAKTVLGDVSDAETGQRGFLLTGQNGYLQPYEDAVRKLPGDVLRLRDLASGRGAVAADVERLTALIDAKLAELQQAITLRRQHGPDAALDVVRTDAGRELMRQIRDLLDGIAAMESGLLRTLLATRAEESARTTRLNVAATLGALLFGVLAVVALERQGRRRLAAEWQLREREERLATTLRSIGDAVITTDAAGCVEYLNPVAESLTGWSTASARGRPLDEIFRIVNETTRETVESPVTKVLRLGGIVGLANHTVLLARDGREIPIDDSGAPIRNPGGVMMGVVLVFRDVSERKAHERQHEQLVRAEAARAAAEETLHTRETAARADARLAAIVDGSDDAIIAKDLDGRITSWNAGAERLFGWTAAEAVGQAITLLAPPERRAEMAGILTRIRNGERVVHFDTVRRRKDGTLVEVSVSVSPVRDATGAVVGASKIVRDVSDRVRSEREREELLAIAERARAEAESANVAKDEFLAVLSHELRSPLNAMMGWIALLKRDALSPEHTRHAVETLERNLRLQAQLVNDLLDVSRIISGKLTMERRPVAFGAVVAGCVATARPAATARGLTLAQDVAVLPGVVPGDETRLQQIVTNLLANAVKFTDPGGRILVRVDVDGPEARLSVADTGVGIAPEFLPHVFDRFRQADSSATRHHGGLGLGLNIVRTLVELHGGRIVVESPGEGRGTTVTVWLPLQPAGGDAVVVPAAAVDGTSPAELGGVRVLLVDDDPDTREALRLALELAGASVVAAPSGGAARVLLDGTPPDVIVSDIGMPGESGYEFLRRVRNGEGPRIPAIAMTGFASREDRDAATRVGFDLHLAKPVSPEVLVHAVRRVRDGAAA